MMLAYRLLQPQTQPEFQEVPEPHAGPGQVVVRVAGSGLCHTDFTVISRDRDHWGAGSVYSATLDGSNKKLVLPVQGNLTGIAYVERSTKEK